jgi:hypothetical protein
MADIPISGLPPLPAPFTGNEPFAGVQSGVTYKGTPQLLYDYVSNTFIYGNGIDFTANTISVDASTQNLKFDAGVLNTIQDIDVNSNPLFNQVTAKAFGVQSSTTIPTIAYGYNALAPGVPFTAGSFAFSSYDSNLNIQSLSRFQTQILNTTAGVVSGAICFEVTEQGSPLEIYEEMNGLTKTIEQFRSLKNLSGYQSFQEQLLLTASQDVDTDIIGRTVINDTVSNQTLTLLLGDSLPNGATFDMIRVGTGDFIVSWPDGVTVDGVNGPSSISLPNQYDRAIITKIKTNDWTYIEYSGSDGVLDLQTAYLNSALPVTISYTSGNEINYQIPDATTKFYTVENLLNGADGNPLSHMQYKGKNDLGTEFVYHNDIIKYRLNFSAPARIESSSREWNFLENGVDTPYFKCDGGVRAAIFYKNLNAIDAYIRSTSTTTAAPEYRFLSDIDGTTNQPVLQINSQSRTSTSLLKTCDTLKVETSDPLPATFSQNLYMQAYRQNSIIRALDYDGTDGSTMMINKATQLPDQNATLADLAGVTTNNIGEMSFQNGNTETALPVQGTAVKIAGTYTAGELVNFSHSSGVLTWNGAETKKFLIIATATLKTATPNTDTFAVIAYKNGVTPIANSENPEFFGPSVDVPQSLTSTAFISLAPTDTVEFRVVNKTSPGNNIIASFLEFAVMDVAGAAGGGVSNASSGDSGLSFVSGTNASGVSIISQLFHKIDDVTHYNASLNFTPTSNFVTIRLGTSAVGNLIEANGVGSIGLPGLESKIAPSDIKTLGILNQSTGAYPLGIWTTIVQSMYGTQTIPANTMVEGDQYKFSAQGRINSTGGGGDGRVRISFGGAVISTSTSMSASNNGFKTWSLEYIITKLSGNNIRVSAFGQRSRFNDSCDVIDLQIPGVVAINTAVDNLVDVEYILDSGVYTFIADSVSLTKINSPVNAVYYSSQFRSLTAVAASKNVDAIFTVSDADLNKPSILNLSFSYEE